MMANDHRKSIKLLTFFKLHACHVPAQAEAGAVPAADEQAKLSAVAALRSTSGGGELRGGLL